MEGIDQGVAVDELSWRASRPNRRLRSEERDIG
jgi:hypothetical protein